MGSIVAGLAARILGPKIIAAVPWRWLAILLLIAGVASLFWAADNHGKRVQKASDAKVIAGLRTDLATSKANEAKVEAAIATQNAAIAAQAKDADAKVAAAHADTVAAQGRYKSTAALVARLSRPASPAGNVARPVGYSDEEVAAWAALAK